MMPAAVLVLLYVFVAMGKCLPSHFLALIGGDTHTDTLSDERDL
jgi:hypothetical protein